ncbi:hypothetical protein [Hugenholtzia roseola]|uniref:hypothetical protein n=1 Tax=Hugenholtzia roseola TaxID=1002 RepID=UPI0012B60F6C|nr:hypothetical protein [Hugenholtzia roseola]
MATKLVICGDTNNGRRTNVTQWQRNLSFAGTQTTAACHLWGHKQRQAKFQLNVLFKPAKRELRATSEDKGNTLSLLMDIKK